MTEQLNEELTFLEFFHAVAIEAKSVGYKPHVVEVFRCNIRDCWERGKTVEETFEEVF